MNDSSTRHPACPHCGQVDMVQRVSSVVASGYQIGSSSFSGFVRGEHVRMFGSSHNQTLLSQRLSPPRMPSYQNPWLLLFVPLVLLLFSWVSPNLMTLLSIGSAIAIGYWAKDEAPRRSAKYKKDLSDYNRGMEKWHQLYYCYRDDGVFLPGENAQFTPTTSIMHFLYQS
jgi:hypothetical protein